MRAELIRLLGIGEHLICFKGPTAQSTLKRQPGSLNQRYYNPVSLEMSSEFVSVYDYKAKAKNILPLNALGYYDSGAGSEYSLRLNCDAFEKIRIRPRFLRDVSQRSAACQVLGIDLTMPIAVAPTAMHRMAHPDGEIATARACGNAGTIYTMSTLSTSSIEEVAKAAPNTNKWFQLYIYKDRQLTSNMVRRAEANGFKAIVLTIDAPLFGIRRADVRNKFKLPDHLELRNFSGDKGIVKSAGGSGINEYVASQFDQTITWKDVKWLIGFTKLPVVLKGILTREDALIAVESGCQGIIVSNHGARQIDTVQATIEALPDIVDAVGDRVIVMLDGGIREGTDVFKAIAYGAQLVFIGRPVLWGLAVNGQKGVEHVLDLLKDEFDRTMALSGTSQLSDINRQYVIHENAVSKL